MFDPKTAQQERAKALAALRDATETDETSEVIARAVEGGVRGALASVHDTDTDPPASEIVDKVSKKKLVTLLITILSALATLATAAVAHYSGK